MSTLAPHSKHALKLKHLSLIYCLCSNIKYIQKPLIINKAYSSGMPRNGRLLRGNKRNDNMMPPSPGPMFGFGNRYMPMMNRPRPPPLMEDSSRWLEPYEQYRHEDNECGPPRNNPRRVNCGELREDNDGDIVEICGRVQNQQLGRFVVIKDSHGATQLVAHEENIARQLQKIPVNANMTVIGRVKKRPLRQINEKIATGGIEVNIMNILSVRRSLPVTSHRPAKIHSLQVRHSSTKCDGVIKITSTEMKRCTTAGIKDAFMQRTHTCGELGAEHVGLKVSLCGWICHNHFCKFIHLKDGYGVVQAVVPPSKVDIAEALKTAETDSTVEISGVVKYRPSGHESPTMDTGMIEVVMDAFSLAKDKTPCEKTCSEKMDADNEEEETECNVNRYSQRTHTCGELREDHIGLDVVLCGWLEFERMKKFIVIRDSYGSTQCVLADELQEIIDAIKVIPFESVIQIEGTVASRPPNSIKLDSPSGQIEVCVKKLKVLNKAKSNLPFTIRDHSKVKESLRLQYRYLDLRFPEMQYNLRMRSKLLMRMREFLINRCDFVDVETPTLFRKTPGGAQEFIVPTQNEGKCYSLVQSPQQLKQMLMVGGIDRYFQIARCYRDEGSRSDRQPEFTQLDVELSFTDRESIMSLVERLLKYTCTDLDISVPFNKITYDEAMQKYGTDRPDLRFGHEIENCTQEFISNSLEKDLPDDFGAYAIVIKNSELTSFPQSFRLVLDGLSSQFPNTKTVKSIIPSSTSEWVRQTSPSITEQVANALNERFQFQPQTMFFLSYGKRTEAVKYLGKVRLEYANYLEKIGKTKHMIGCQFLWVTDFPLFETDEKSNLTSVHHPFTQPHPEDIDLVESEPLKARSLAFDLVLNGYEVGGGSIRIHDAQYQKHILDMLKINSSSMSYLLDALEAGCPPHGGIALGIDRLISMLLKTSSIREVIAFPKTIDGKDLLSGAPSDLSEVDKDIYSIVLQPVTAEVTV